MKTDCGKWLFYEFFTVVALLLCGSLAAQQAEYTEVAKRAEGNPTLAILKFLGTAEERQELERAIAFSGWFQLQNSAGQHADILVQAQAQRIADGTARFHLMVQGNQQTMTLQKTGKNLREAAFLAVDEIIQRLFGVTGPLSRKIMYVFADGKGKKEIFSCYPDGSAHTRLTFNNAISTEPSFGAKGKMLYTLLKNNSQSIVLQDQMSRRQKVISCSPGLNASAGLSRNGQWIALPLSLDGMVDLYLIDLQKNTRKRLTKDKNIEASPTWSPDGSRIVFVSNRMGTPQLFELALGDYKVRRLTTGGVECVSPEWSAVSNQLCYCTKENGRYVIAVMDMGHPDHEVRIVTPGSGYWEAPSWAPDGRHIVCTRGAANGARRDLYIVDTTLLTARRLSSGVNVSLPAWEP